MKIKKIIIGVLAVALLNVGAVLIDQEPALAYGSSCSLSSSTNAYGRTSTYGSCDGKTVSLSSSTNAYGRTSTYGSIGNSTYSTSSSTNAYGRTSTYGSLGRDRISLSSSTNAYGRTSTSGFAPWKSVNNCWWNC